jgi:hypothetical protein
VEKDRHNAVHNAIYGPIHRAALKRKRIEENIRIIAQDPVRAAKLLTGEEIAVIITDIYEHHVFEELGGKTLREALGACFVFSACPSKRHSFVFWCVAPPSEL